MPAKPIVHPYRIAKSLDRLRAEVDAKFPHRGKANDGWIGDIAHQHTNSDHNPQVMDGKTGVVTALDITNDPAHGCVANDIARKLAASRDPRIKYVISNGMWVRSYAMGGAAAWTWRPYTGKNPHNKHFHISVRALKSLYDSVADWKF
jgi:hypothetical protein